MEKTLPDSPTTKTSSPSTSAGPHSDTSFSDSTEPSTDAGATIRRDSERPDESMPGETASEATMPILDAAPDIEPGYLPEYAFGEYTFADEIELATKEPAKVDADSELMDSLSSVPQKMAFKIGEVAEMLGVKQYVLRYWETEFEALRPKKSKNNQRVYTRREVETAMLIKKLLYKDRFSIEGARAALKQLRGQVKEERNWKAVAQGQHKVADRLQALIGDIRRLHDSLAF